jgi:adenine deaminase
MPMCILRVLCSHLYQQAPPACAFIQGIGLKQGAIASSVAHDSHNVVAVETSDEALCRAINLVIESEGGLAVVQGMQQLVLSLPVAGLMSNQDGYEVARKYALLEELVRQMGSPLSSPFMTLSFMTLLAIPTLKLSDKGLFDGGKVCFYTCQDSLKNQRR